MSVEKILIVDDNTENIKLTANILKKDNRQISVAKNGYAALELIKKETYDVVLLDIMMPGMSGYDVMKELKKTDDIDKNNVIFLTAKTDEHSIIDGLEMGAVDFISKPFNKRELIARVNTHVEISTIRRELKENNELLAKKNLELEEALKEVNKLSRTDVLTGIFNRREVIENIEYEMKRYRRLKRQFSILLADIDYFKRINDTYGHSCGDYILKEVAVIMRDRIREQDIASRWGGEEFLIMLPETGKEGALELAESIREIIENRIFNFQDIEIRITITIGAAVYEGEGIDRLIDKADQCLYDGKAGGRNKVVG